jgi:hypothetical protein
MRTADAAVLTALEQARTFIDTHPQQLDQLESAGYRHKLDDVIASLKQLSVEQDASDRMSDGQLARQGALRATLRLNHMAPIAAIAAARLRDVPEFNAFQLPLYRAKTADLVIAADAMAKMARPYATTFIDAGLADDFVEQLEAAAKALADTLIDRQTSLTVRAGASAGLRTEASRGRHVLRVLSALIEPRLKNDEALLAGWRSARHIRRPASPQRPSVYPLLGLAFTQPAPAQLALPPAPIENLADQISNAQIDATVREPELVREEVVPPLSAEAESRL